jgi:hypothetical protein
MARRKIIISSKTTVKLGQDLIDILKDAKLKQVRVVIQEQLDLELSRMFKFISSQMLGGSNFAILKPYLPQPWKTYSKEYAKQKNKVAGHLRWFSLTDKLATQLAGVSERRLRAQMGKAKITISRDRTVLTARMAPHLRLSLNNMEDQFASSGLISKKSLIKLKGRSKNYRALIGPVFEYFMRNRLPQQLRKTIRGLQ